MEDEGLVKTPSTKTPRATQEESPSTMRIRSQTAEMITPLL